MSRDLDQAILDVIYSDGSTDPVLQLVQVKSGDGTVVGRFVENGVDIISNGQTFSASAISVRMPTDTDAEVAVASIVVENVSHTIVADLRQETGVPTIVVSHVLASAPDDEFYGPWEFDVVNTSVTAQAIRAELRFDDLLNEPFPVGGFTPNNFPMLFSAVAN